MAGKSRCEPTYTARAVCTAIGLSHGTLNSWAHMGVFRLAGFQASRTTAGKARRFPLTDAVGLAIIKRLFDNFKISPVWLAPSVKRMLIYMNRYGERLTEWNIRFYDDSESHLPNDDLLDNGQKPEPGERTKLTIYPWRIVDDLKRKLDPTKQGA